MSYKVEYDDQRIIYSKIKKKKKNSSLVVCICVTLGVMLANYIGMQLWQYIFVMTEGMNITSEAIGETSFER